MAVETADDRAIYLADFGVTVTYSGGSFVGIFDNAYTDVDAGGGVAISMVDPRLSCRTADVTGVSEGDTITIGGNSYIVRVKMPDGTGMTELMLEAA